MSNAAIYISLWVFASVIFGVALGTAVDRMGRK